MWANGFGMLKMPNRAEARLRWGKGIARRTGRQGAGFHQAFRCGTGRSRCARSLNELATLFPKIGDTRVSTERP